MLLAEKIPYRAEMGEVYRYLKVQLQELKVPIHYGIEVDKAKVDEKAPDCVIIATGSYPTLPDYAGSLPGFEVIDSRTAMQDITRIGQNVLLFDDIGYWQGLGVADYISTIGSKVTVVTPKLYAGVDIEETCRELLNKRLYRNGANIITSHRLKEFRGSDIVLENIFNHAEMVVKGIDMIVAAQASVSEAGLYRQLKSEGYNAISVGDAKAPRTILQVIFDAEELGRAL
jgi:pyruvate/2-oxoglutarate dehydrogenase complex dihydrolipoamide dehydrogenase (E3) component